MKFYNSFKTSDGFFTAEWSGEEMFNFNFFFLLFVGCVFSLFSVIISFILIIITIYDYEDEGVKPSILGVLFSGYFLLDMNYHWLIWCFLSVLEGLKMIQWFVSLNIVNHISYIFTNFINILWCYICKNNIR